MAAGSVEFSLVDPLSAPARLAVDRYFEELAVRFDGGFDAAAYARGSAVAEPGLFLIGARDGEPVACGALRPLGPAIAEIKRMWVDPDARGLGLGRRLLTALEERAAERGWSLIRLDTNAALTEAIALYQRSGYRPIPRYNDNPYAQLWFEKSLRDTPRHGRTNV